MAADEARCRPRKGWRRWVPETHFREAAVLPGAGKGQLQHRWRRRKTPDSGASLGYEKD